MRNITSLVVHHTGMPRNSYGSTLAGVNEHHRTKNWGWFLNVIRARKNSLGYYVQYHYFIDGEGQLTRTREDSEIGWHAKQANDHSVAICIAGDFDEEYLNDDQLTTFKQLLGKLLRTYNLSPLAVMGHNAVVRTDCPGEHLMPQYLTRIAMDVHEESQDESLIPGELVKNAGDPKVYVIGRSGTPLWIVDEGVFHELWGDWSEVRTVKTPLNSTTVIKVVELE